MTHSTAARPTLRVFYAYLTQALKHKTQCSGWRVDEVRRKVYGICVAYLKVYPDEQPTISTDIDKLPPSMDPDWYKGAIRGLIAERVSQHEADAAQGRADDRRPPQALKDVLEAMVPG